MGEAWIHTIWYESLCECNTHYLCLKLLNLWSNMYKYEQLCDFPINLPLNKSNMGKVSYNMCLTSSLHSVPVCILKGHYVRGLKLLRGVGESVLKEGYVLQVHPQEEPY